MDPANERKYEGDVIRCFGCRAREEKWSLVQQLGSNLAGLRPFAELVD